MVAPFVVTRVQYTHVPIPVSFRLGFICVQFLAERVPPCRLRRSDFQQGSAFSLNLLGVVDQSAGNSMQSKGVVGEGGSSTEQSKRNGVGGSPGGREGGESFVTQFFCSCEL